MPPASSTDSRLRLFLNLGHTLDHLFMLIFPTVVLAISVELDRPYAELLPLALGGFIAFGACSIPAGWLADRWSRHRMMVLFFAGIGLASIVTGLAAAPWHIALGLTLIGVFAAIYHPVGIAMLVSNEPNVGRTLGVNGVWGNAGLAFAALISGALAEWVHWRAAFIFPGVLSLAVAAVFARIPAPMTSAPAGRKPETIRLPREIIVRVFVALVIATVCGGVIFNATTISMPKLFDERLTALTQSTVGIGVLVCVTFLIAAIAQLIVGSLIDRIGMKGVFLIVSAFQVPLLWLAGSTQDWLMLGVAIAMMFFVFGLIPINDAMVARYTAEEWRARAYAVRYVVSFGASATAVPLVAFIHKAGGGFQALYPVLAVFALFTFAAALFFPSPRVRPAAA